MIDAHPAWVLREMREHYIDIGLLTRPTPVQPVADEREGEDETPFVRMQEMLNAFR